MPSHLKPLETLAYFIDMECMAILTADDTLTPDEALRGVTITGHSVVYGAIRKPSVADGPTTVWPAVAGPVGTQTTKIRRDHVTLT